MPAARILNIYAIKQKVAEQFDTFPISTVGRDPVAVPEKIFGLTLILDFFDRCHSLVSLTPPQAAVDSLPTGRAEICRTTVRMRRGRIYPARGITDRQRTYGCSVNLP